MADALVRGEITVGPFAYNGIVLKMREGAPIGYIYPPAGVPCFTFVAGITKTAKRPAAPIADTGHLTALKAAPIPLPGFDPTAQKLWFPDRAESDRVRVAWQQDWGKAYGMRQ